MKLHTALRLGSWTSRVDVPNLSFQAGDLTGWTHVAGASPSVTQRGVTLWGAVLQRTITGLTPGERLTLKVRASWTDTSSSPGRRMLPSVTLDDGAGGQLVERYVATAHSRHLGADDPANRMLLDYTVPASGQLRLTLYGDQVPILGAYGRTRFDRLELLRGEDVFHLELDSRYPEPDPAAGRWVLDGFTHSWSLGDDWPTQPDPSTATMTLAAVGAAQLPPLEIGTRASVWVQALYPDGAELQAVYVDRFEGRISDAAAAPAFLPVDDGAGGVTEVRGIAVELTLVDLQADAAETYIGAEPWPESMAPLRLEDILQAAGQPELVDFTLPSALDYFQPLDVDHRSLADVMEEHLAQLTRWTGAGSDNPGWRRGILATQVADGWSVEGLGLLDGDGTELPGESVYRLQLLAERSTVDGGPLRLVRTGDVVGTELDLSTTARGHKAMDADYVDLSVEWRRDKGRATNRAAVGGEFRQLYDWDGTPLGVAEIEARGVVATQVVAEWPEVVAKRGRITLAKDSSLAYIHSAQRLAMMLRGDKADSLGRWAVESATFYLSQLPDYDTAMRLLSGTPLFPDPISRSDLNLSRHAVLPYGKLLLIHNLEAAHQLEAEPYLAGALAGAQLQLANGQAAITVELRPGVPRQHYATAGGTADTPLLPATPLTLDRRHPGTTVRDKGDGTPYIDPTLTPYQLRLARNE